MRMPGGQYHLGKADPGCAEEKAGVGLQPAIHSLWKCQRLSRQRGEDRNRVPATGPSPRQGGASAGPMQPAQPFDPPQAEGRGPAPAPSPAGSDSGTSSCQGHRQEEVGGWLLGPGLPPEQPAPQSLEEPGTQGGSERYKAEREGPVVTGRPREPARWADQEGRRRCPRAGSNVPLWGTQGPSSGQEPQALIRLEPGRKVQSWGCLSRGRGGRALRAPWRRG